MAMEIRSRSFQYIDDLIEGLLQRLMNTPDEITGPDKSGKSGRNYHLAAGQRK